ncbi:MAG: type II secretion system protein, tight adherence protein C [Candidatus Peregrinibacteria bacterium GW2011_GWF2_33_10]|nr:MAG: type II secretion system protein, tight adherence protein C [Candidatus Peregrinibacteria bacterium GW2011_GWF2_33_10]
MPVSQIIIIFILFAFFLYFFGKFLFPSYTINLEDKSKPLFLRIIRKKLFKPGFIIKKCNSEKKIRYLLALAGCPYDLTVDHIMRIQELFLFTCEIYVFIRLWIVGGFWKHLFLYIVLGLIVFYLPLLWLRAEGAKRRVTFEKKLPPNIDLLILAIEGGMNLEYAVEHLSMISDDVCAKEFLQVSKEMHYGISIEEALKNMQKRIENEDFDRFVMLLLQAKQLGVSLGKSLRIQADLMRTRKKQKAEELSRTASVKIMIPLVCCIFPALLIIYLTPGVIQFLNIMK